MTSAATNIYEQQLAEAQAAFLSSCPETPPAEEQAPPHEPAPGREFAFLTAEDVLALKMPPGA